MRRTQHALGAVKTEKKGASGHSSAHEVIDGATSVVIARNRSAGFSANVADGVFSVLVKGVGKQKATAAIFVDAGAPKHAVGVKPIVLAGVQKASFVGRLTFAVYGAETALTRVVGAFEGRWVRSLDDGGR